MPNLVFGSLCFVRAIGCNVNMRHKLQTGTVEPPNKESVLYKEAVLYHRSK